MFIAFGSYGLLQVCVILYVHCRLLIKMIKKCHNHNWAPSSEFVSSSIPLWQILTAHAQTFRGARDLAFCLKVPLDSLLVWASSEGSGETVRMRRLAWTFAARIGDKYQIRLTRSNYTCHDHLHRLPIRSRENEDKEEQIQLSHADKGWMPIQKISISQLKAQILKTF